MNDSTKFADLGLQRPRLVLSVADGGSLLACIAFFTAWTCAAEGRWSAGVLVAWTAISIAFYGAGAVASRWTSLWRGIPMEFPLKLLVGFVIVNTAVLSLAWIAPRLVAPGFVTLMVAVLVALAWMRPSIDLGVRTSAAPAFLVTLLSLLAATFWCQDTLHATTVDGQFTVFKPWVDSFFHAAQIANISGAHGSAAIEDVQLAYEPARFYHYAPYATPALVKALSSITAYAAFGGVLVPLGVLLTGAASYSLATSWWGPWPGLAAAATLLLVPDASHHGAHNPFLGYHWLQIVGPAGMYGVALLALAWLLVLRGCQRASVPQTLSGWLVGALTTVYKAQFFVANAMLLWMLPPLASKGVRTRVRVPWLVAAAAVFAVAVVVANASPAFPTLRLDGSSTREFLWELVLVNMAPSGLKELFEAALGPTAGDASVVVWGGILLVASAVGLFFVAYVALAAVLRRRVQVWVLLFPGLVLLNFLVMALGLAFDDRGVGTREELLHRPFVWAYFVTATWVGGAAAFAALGEGATSRWRRAALCAIVAVMLVVPWRLGRGVQAEPPWALVNLRVPTAVLDAARHLREHAHASDVVQDAHGDPYLVFAALSERRPFVVAYWSPTRYAAREVAVRREYVSGLLSSTEPVQVKDLASRLGIRWLLLYPGDAVAWPQAMVDRPVFAADGFTLYRFE